jgi:hypothetical protein
MTQSSLSSLSQLSNYNLNNIKNNVEKNSKLENNVVRNNVVQMNNQKNNELKNNVMMNQKNSENKKIEKKVKKEKVYELVDFPETGQSYGEYKGKTPKQAARKAFSRLARMSKLNNSNQKFIVFVIKEKGGKQKEHKYMGQRVRLANDGIKIKRGNQTVTIKYKNIVNKYKDL